MAGIIAGDGTASSGHYSGTAPEVGLVSVRVLDASGTGKTSDVIAGIDWVIKHHRRLDVRVMNLSLGHPVFAPAEFDPLVQAVLAETGVTDHAASPRVERGDGIGQIIVEDPGELWGDSALGGDTAQTANTTAGPAVVGSSLPEGD